MGKNIKKVILSRWTLFLPCLCE